MDEQWKSTYDEQRYERLAESLDEYLMQEFLDGSNGFDVLKRDIERAVGEMITFPECCLKNINSLRKLIE